MLQAALCGVTCISMSYSVLCCLSGCLTLLQQIIKRWWGHDGGAGGLIGSVVGGAYSSGEVQSGGRSEADRTTW